MRFAVEYFLHSINGVSDDNDLGHIFFNAGLVDTTSDGEQFHFYACYKYCMMNCFGEKMVGYVHVQYRYSNVVLDASICYYKGCM